MSRAGRDHTRRFPALVAAIAALPPSTLILDGELRARPEAETATLPIFMAFDYLWLAGRDLRDQG